MSDKTNQPSIFRFQGTAPEDTFRLALGAITELVPTSMRFMDLTDGTRHSVREDLEKLDAQIMAAGLDSPGRKVTFRIELELEKQE